MCQINCIKVFRNIFRVDWNLNFSTFHKLDMETNLFTWLKIHTLHIQFKIKISSLLSDLFIPMQGFCQRCLFSVLLYITEAEVLSSFINVYKRIKRLQIADHEIIIVSFVGYTTIFLRDIACHKWYQNCMAIHLAQR